MPSDCHDVGLARNSTTCARLNEADQQGVDDMRWFWLVLGSLILLVGVVIWNTARFERKKVSPRMKIVAILVDVLFVGFVVVTWPWEVAHLTEGVVHPLFQWLRENLVQFLKDLVRND